MRVQRVRTFRGSERSQRDHYWKPALKALGIRYRRAYCARHTYATVALMGGVNPAYIARQLGHENAKMVFEKYAKWIVGADKGAARRRWRLHSGRIRPKFVPKRQRTKLTK